jgi:PAS domain S-box-containing protein
VNIKNEAIAVLSKKTKIWSRISQVLTDRSIPVALVLLAFPDCFSQRIAPPAYQLIPAAGQLEVLSDSPISADTPCEVVFTLEERLLTDLKPIHLRILKVDTTRIVSLHGCYMYSKRLMAAPRRPIHNMSESDLSGHLSLLRASLLVGSTVMVSLLILAYFGIRERRAERTKQERERTYRKIYNATSTAIILFDARSGSILEANPSTLDMFGYTYREITKLTFFDLGIGEVPYSRKETEELIDKILHEGSQVKEWVCKCKNGEPFWSEMSLKRIVIGGKNRILNVIRNIDRRKRTEEALAVYRGSLEQLIEKRTSELKAAQEELIQKEQQATLGRLTATVSHELRNPLGTINSSLFLIEERIRGQDSGVDRALDRVKRNMERCKRIIAELLDYTEGQVSYFEETDIDRWLADLLDELDIPDNIELERKLTANRTLSIDREHCRRCVINVLSNAFQAIQQKEDRNFEGLVKVETELQKERVEIRVSDNGLGMLREELGRIFEPFSGSKKFGIGLGLPVTKQILEQHGGGIEIGSTRARGTTVVLWLPARNA